MIGFEEATQLLDILPPVLVVSFVNVIQEDLSALLAVSKSERSNEMNNNKNKKDESTDRPVFVLNLLLDVSQVLAGDVTFKILAELFRC